MIRFITVESFEFLKEGGGQFSWIVGCFFICGDVISWIRRFAVSVRQISHSKFVFVEDSNSWRRRVIHGDH